MKDTLPPLSTNGMPEYREWTQSELREHMRRVLDLADSFLAAPQITEEMFAEIEKVTGPPQM